MTTEELLIRAADRCTMNNLKALRDNLRQTQGTQELASLAESFDLLWEAFPEEPEFEEAEFVLDCARIRIPDSALFRQVLSTAVKTVLPPYLAKAGVLRAIGLRDTAVQPGEIIRRIDRLTGIKSGIVTYLFEAGRWGMISTIDPLNATVAVNVYDGGAIGIPLEKVITRGYFFKNSIATEKMVSASKRAKLSSSDFRRIVAEQSCAPISEGSVKALAEKIFVPGIVAAADFESWYAAETAPAPVVKTAVRTSAHARSLKEMDLLLAQEIAAKVAAVNEADVAGFTAFFTHLNQDVAKREPKLLAEVIAKLAERVDNQYWAAIMAPLKGKAAFWPLTPNECVLESLVVWGDLPVKLTNRLCVMTQAIFGAEYLAALAARLPLKSLNVCAEHLEGALIDAAFSNPPLITCDILLWTWKNRKSHPALVKLLTFENVVAALSISRFPKEWGPAQRDLHTQLLDKEDFQQFMVSGASEADIPTLVGALAGASSFTTGERQSLLVKLSRYSDKIREHLEGGAASKVLGAKAAGREPAPTVEEPIYTSLASHRRLMQELHDIINVYQPENREALAAARAHGDFRENAEFDAAKERRNFLTKRRNELERDLARINALDFRTITPQKFVDFGTTVELAVADGSKETYYFLGAWDGDPDKKYLSYKTKLGEVLRGHQAGDELQLPDGRKAKVAAISALPEAVLKDME